jgi:hypothetical protein
MDPMIILDKNSLSILDPDLIKERCFYTTFDCLNSFSQPNLPYNKEARHKIKQNIKFLSENKKIIVTQKDNKIRTQLKEYIEGFYPLLTSYILSESRGTLSTPNELDEDSSFLIDCILCSLANADKRIIIFTTNPGIIELFDKLSNALETIKILFPYGGKENNLFYALTQKLNLSIISEVRKLESLCTQHTSADNQSL